MVDLEHKAGSSLQACGANYAGATKNMEMSLSAKPKLAVSACSKTMNNYDLRYNKNITDFYAT